MNCDGPILWLVFFKTEDSRQGHPNEKETEKLGDLAQEITPHKLNYPTAKEEKETAESRRACREEG